MTRSVADRSADARYLQCRCSGNNALRHSLGVNPTDSRVMSPSRMRSAINAVARGVGSHGISRASRAGLIERNRPATGTSLHARHLRGRDHTARACALNRVRKFRGEVCEAGVRCVESRHRTQQPSRITTPPAAARLPASAPEQGAPAERRIDSVLGGLSMGLAQLSWQDDLGGRSINRYGISSRNPPSFFAKVAIDFSAASGPGTPARTRTPTQPGSRSTTIATMTSCAPMS